VLALLVSVTGDASVARGRYLANGIARCFWCHSRLEDGAFRNTDPPRGTIRAHDAVDAHEAVPHWLEAPGD